ncbi:DUF2110 family protein [Halobacterium salinarum]|uniref:DUF2110 family protein n=5 Tax=Halobacterium salinarum TaxID=2242 RepID=Q9HRC6_HALSA|nr:DUF2110 family protein [Halobacterium salinarum]AAG19232.1 conserved hypothetical protein [Halobacterium salinarum NRC-1]MDL0120790.1 DUF2110 family protein [Halobacterium salinarum]MDL0132985.1 DUF2110 family protein [Halobacterium salinarum]MDL0138645.1 DUF2110 family protein [Halobacterium salinarum]UEB92656.1 DUF2110 family protein [Halobacterium salinarum NRC-34001]
MVVLATKVYVSGDARERALDGLRSLVGNDIGSLAVTVDVGVRHDDFPTVTLEGPDEVAARNALVESWGEITPEFESGETYVGTLASWDDDGIVLDAGEDVRVPAAELDLGPGTPSQIRERFGLVQHMPLRFVHDDDGPAALADAERDRLYEWTRGSGRLNVNSATRGEVRATVNRAGHARDIVTVERIGLLEQSVICKDSTDPPGLLAAIGQHLPSELLAVVP